jgi:cobalt-zinc-cadmium efflux system protein
MGRAIPASPAGHCAPRRHWPKIAQGAESGALERPGLPVETVHALTHFRSATWIVKVSLLLTVALVVTEFVAGYLAQSLALISDAWHNFIDLPALGLAWLALYFERKPPDHQKTFGYHRAGVLAAFVNGLFLIAIALYICYEGYERILNPQTVTTRLMLFVGLLALVINGGIAAALALHRSDLNLRAVFIHNLGDALSNIGIIVGAVLIEQTGRMIIDPLLAFLIAGMILWTAVDILVESGNILLEGTPKGMNVERVAGVMLDVPGVREVHDIHIWSLNARAHALSCHVQILDMATSETERIAHRLREVLAREFGIHHTTIQFEHTHAPGEFHIYMPEPAEKSKQ